MAEIEAESRTTSGTLPLSLPRLPLDPILSLPPSSHLVHRDHPAHVRRVVLQQVSRSSAHPALAAPRLPRVTNVHAEPLGAPLVGVALLAARQLDVALPSQRASGTPVVVQLAHGYRGVSVAGLNSSRRTKTPRMSMMMIVVVVVVVVVSCEA